MVCRPRGALSALADHRRSQPRRLLARFYPRETLLAHLDFLSSAFLAGGSAPRPLRRLPLLLLHQPARRLHSTSARHYAFAEVSSVMPQPLRPREKKSSAHTTPSKSYCRRSLSPSRSLPCQQLTRCWSNCGSITTRRRSIVRSALDSPKPHGSGLAEKNARPCAPTARCLWWPYVLEPATFLPESTPTAVSPSLHNALRIDRPPGSKVIRCFLHPNGDHSILAAAPAHGLQPILLLHSPAPKPVAL